MKLRDILAVAALGATALPGVVSGADLNYDRAGITSAYVTDNAIGSTYTNYYYVSPTGAADLGQAAGTYLGSFTVDQGPSFTDDPPAYTGQQAAAVVYGGLFPGLTVHASDFSLSTSSNTSDINHMNWVSTFGVPGGEMVAQNFAVTPEPAAWALMLVGVGAVGVSLRSRSRAARATA